MRNNTSSTRRLRSNRRKSIVGTEISPPSSSFGQLKHFTRQHGLSGGCETPPVLSKTRKAVSDSNNLNRTLSCNGLTTDIARLVLLGEDPYGDHPYIPTSVPTTLLLSRSKTVIGRDPSRCHIVVDSEKYVGTLSRAHCAIFREMKNNKSKRRSNSSNSSISSNSSNSSNRSTASSVQWWMEDLRSTNGTFVNGIAMRSTSCRLRHGDVVTLGTNDRNAAELKDGEWWEVERWSDTVFRFECIENKYKNNQEQQQQQQQQQRERLSTPSPTSPSTGESSGFDSDDVVPSQPVSPHMSLSTISSSSKVFRSRPVPPSRQMSRLQNVHGTDHLSRSTKRRRTTTSTAVTTSIPNLLSTKLKRKKKHIKTINAGDNTPNAKGGARYTTQEVQQGATARSTSNWKSNAFNSFNSSFQNASAFEGLKQQTKTRKRTQPDTTSGSSSSSSSTPILQNQLLSSNNSMSLSLVTANMRRDVTSTPVSTLTPHSPQDSHNQTATTGKQFWNNQTPEHIIHSSTSSVSPPGSTSNNQSTIPFLNNRGSKSPPLLIRQTMEQSSMGSPLPRAARKTRHSSSSPLKNENAQAKVLASTSSSSLFRKDVVDAADAADTADVAVVGRRTLNTRRKGQESETIETETFKTDIETETTTKSTNMNMNINMNKDTNMDIDMVNATSITYGEEYVPVGMDPHARHPLEGATLVVVTAASLPPLDPSCAMWGVQRRSRWEHKAHREGNNMYVKVKSQLGKGGSALVFKGSVVKDPSFSSSSSSSSSSVRRSSRLGQQQHNTRFGNTIFNTSNSSENEAEDSDEELKLKLKSKTKTKTSSKRKQNNDNDNDNDNEDIGMEVALKVVARNDASSISAFWTELDALTSLNKDASKKKDGHVVRLIGVCFDADYVVAIISYHRGGPLSKWWKRHRKLNRGQKVGEVAVAKVLQGVGRALHFCHQSGRLHLDVKENNVVFDRGVGDVDNVILIDFGCAVSVTESNGIVIDTGYDDYFEGGTFCCMAPEVLAIAVRALRHKRLLTGDEPPSFGPKADVWSLGVMAHVLLTGRYPYGLTGDRSDDVEANELLQRMMDSDKPWDGARDRKQLSSKAQHFLNRLLTIDKKERPSLNEAMQDPFILDNIGLKC